MFGLLFGTFDFETLLLFFIGTFSQFIQLSFNCSTSLTRVFFKTKKKTFYIYSVGLGTSTSFIIDGTLQREHLLIEIRLCLFNYFFFRGTI